MDVSKTDLSSLTVCTKQPNAPSHPQPFPASYHETFGQWHFPLEFHQPPPPTITAQRFVPASALQCVKSNALIFTTEEGTIRTVKLRGRYIYVLKEQREGRRHREGDGSCFTTFHLLVPPTTHPLDRDRDCDGICAIQMWQLGLIVITHGISPVGNLKR